MNDSNDFMIIEGSGCVMLSAPHNVEQIRGGKVKPAEPQTGQIARKLSAETGCSAIVKTRTNNDDANYDEASAYRDALVQFVKERNVKVVFDLHQLSPEREVAFSIGTGEGANLRDEVTLGLLQSALAGLDLGPVQIDEFFRACGKNTVGATVARECDVTCIQLEMNSKFLFDASPECAIDRVSDALKDTIETLDLEFAAKDDNGCIPVSVVDCVAPRDGCLYGVAVSPSFYRENFTRSFVLVSLDGKRKRDIHLYPSFALDGNQIAITADIGRRVGIGEGDKAFLQELSCAQFEHVRIQSVDKVAGDDVVLSRSASCGESTRDLLASADLFEIKDVITNQSFIVKKDRIIFDDTLAEGTIKLNRRQRIFLGENFPCRLNGIMREHVVESYERSSTAETVQGDIRAIMEQAYCSQEPVRQPLASYAERQQLQQAFKNISAGVIVRPIDDRPIKRNLFKRFGRKISDVFVGKSVLALMCRRPYANDENDRAVRMTRDNMAHLGIEEMDNVILTYKTKQAVCQVIALDDEDKLRANNLFTPVDMTIGVPLSIRRELGIDDLDSTVKVERDTAFIMKKCANEQLIPVLLALFSMNFLADYPLYVPLIVFVILVPIIIYVNLSSKRNSRSKY